MTRKRKSKRGETASVRTADPRKNREKKEGAAADRAKVLYRYDGANAVRFSHENPDVKALYADYFGKPLSEKAHHLLHSDHTADWKMPGIMKK